MPKEVVIVGGSLAGLMQALQFKRRGHAVTVLEQDPASDRASHEAGVSYGANMAGFLRDHDDTGLTSSGSTLESAVVRIAWRRWPSVHDLKIPRRLSNWAFLYRVLRANLDGLVSETCSKPPPGRPGDGQARYLGGKRVVGLVRLGEDRVRVDFEDVRTGVQEGIEADLVIGADGVHSTMRKLVGAQMVSEKSYAGYVAWRGCVKESLLSQETIEYFTARVIFEVMKNSFLVVYHIPTDKGNTNPGDRLVNFIWYHNVPDSSPEMDALLTDIHGVRHRNTVARRLTDPASWARARDAFLGQMAAPVAELVGVVRRPFVTRVHDALCAEPTYWNGRVVLVGDAFATIRPHTAVATDQAARHAASLWAALPWEEGDEIKEKKGDCMRVWANDTCRLSTRLWLLSRVVGEYGQGSWMSFFGAAWAYLTFMFRLKILRK